MVMPKGTRRRPGAATVRRVLVVEDSATQREALRHELEGAGYEARNYVGSWHEWSADESLPVASGQPAA